MDIVVFLPNWLGDAVMATPSLRALRRHHGTNTHIAGVMHPNLRGLFAGTDWIDEELYHSPHNKDGLSGMGLVRTLRRQKFDLAFLLPNSFRTAMLAWLAGARRRIGYVRAGRGPFLTDRVYPRREKGTICPVPAVDYYLTVAEAAGCKRESQRLELALTPEEEQLADHIWHDLGLRTDGRVIALNSSGAYGAAKLWPAEHFGDLARRLAEETDHDVLVVCGPRERQMARAIVERAGHDRVRSLAQTRLGLSATKACLSRSRLTVSTDSGPRHIAAAFGRPVVTLFGPTLPIWIRNPTVRAVDIQLDLDCAGCGKRQCPRGDHLCMRDLSVERVYGEVVKLLETSKAVVAGY